MSMNERTFNEKRDFIRMKINSPVTVMHAGSSYKAICKDLSGTGLSIQTDQALPVGDDVTISIEQDGKSHLPFNAEAKISRVQPGNSGGYLIGLAITEISEKPN